MGEVNVNMVVSKIFNSNESHNWKPSEKIPLVTREIENLKSDLKSFLADSDYDILSVANESRELCQASKVLIEEMEACQERIEQKTMAEILKSIEHHDNLTKELDEVDFALKITHNIFTCARFLKDYETSQTFNSLSQAVEVISDMLQFLEMPADGFESLSIYKSFKYKALNIWDHIMVDLTNQFNSLFHYSMNSTAKKNTITIDIKMTYTNGSDALNALIISKKLPAKIAEFSNFLLKEVLIPIIHKECVVYAETEELMTVTVSLKPQPKPAYNVVIANLRLVFQYLNQRLNIDIDAQETLMTLVSKDISKEFSEILIKDCLIDTIPNSINELQTYGGKTMEIEEFQQFLTMVKFFPDGKLSILQYVDNIDVLFAEKSSKYFLETARLIMLKDLSNTMSIGVETVPNNTAPTTDFVDMNDEEALKIFDSTIPQSLFYFPRCMISKSAQELLDLVYMMMEQAVQCSDVVCKRLYVTTKLVFELYDAVVPYHHENFLQTIPQYVALYHNNCMYLAHNLQTFGDKWLTLMEGRSVQYPIGFLELVPRLRASAQRSLARHMQTQRSQIHHYIRSSDLNCIVVKDVLSDNAEQAIRQCLRQGQLLKNVWIGVFPINVFTRLMATLVNMFVDEIIHRVCTVEDISAEMAAQLGDIYGLVVKKAPNLFQKPSDIEEHVKSWVKLQELIEVLRGSLKDIEKRWDEGKGPLAVHFRIEELRSLIKALFQNTQIRANLLSKIK